MIIYSTETGSQAKNFQQGFKGNEIDEKKPLKNSSHRVATIAGEVAEERIVMIF